MKQLLFCLAVALSFQVALANGPVPKDNTPARAKHAVAGKKSAAEQPLKPAACIGRDKKLINGVCETAERVFTRTVYNSVTHMYNCYYYFLWSDGSTSQEYFMNSSAPCMV